MVSSLFISVGWLVISSVKKLRCMSSPMVIIIVVCLCESGLSPLDLCTGFAYI